MPRNPLAAAAAATACWRDPLAAAGRDCPRVVLWAPWRAAQRAAGPPGLACPLASAFLAGRATPNGAVATAKTRTLHAGARAGWRAPGGRLQLCLAAGGAQQRARGVNCASRRLRLFECASGRNAWAAAAAVPAAAAGAGQRQSCRCAWPPGRLLVGAGLLGSLLAWPRQQQRQRRRQRHRPCAARTWAVRQCLQRQLDCVGQRLQAGQRVLCVSERRGHQRRASLLAQRARRDAACANPVYRPCVARGSHRWQRARK